MALVSLPLVNWVLNHGIFALQSIDGPSVAAANPPPFFNIELTYDGVNRWP